MCLSSLQLPKRKQEDDDGSQIRSQKPSPQLPVRAPQRGAFLCCAGCSSAQRAVTRCETDPAVHRTPQPPRAQLRYKSWDGEHPSITAFQSASTKLSKGTTTLCAPASRCLLCARGTQPYLCDAAVSLQRQSGDFAPKRFPSHETAPPHLQCVVPCPKLRLCHVFARILFLENSSFTATLLLAPHPLPISNERGRQCSHRSASHLHTS